MAINYTWSVFSMHKQNTESLQEAVCKVVWTRLGTDDADGVSGSMFGSTELDLAALDPNNFTPFASLTEQQVAGWLETVEAGNLAYYNSVIEKSILEKRNVVRVERQNLPWAPQE
jgi:hypothetical protein